MAYLASFSKLLFPALRLSYVVLPEALVPAAEKRMMAEPARPSLLGQGALARFIADGHFATLCGAPACSMPPARRRC